MAPLIFSKECPTLPAERPIGFPHVIANAQGFHEDTDSTHLTFADGIATFLWLWNQDQFHRFFDLSEDKFEIAYNAPNQPIKCLVISRTGNMVIVGVRDINFDVLSDAYTCQAGFRSYGEWDPQMGYTIEEDGRWKPQHCSEASNPAAIEGFGNGVAKAILFHRLWKLPGEGTKVDVYHD